jgi:class 3 adenylate cyclase
MSIDLETLLDCVADDAAYELRTPVEIQDIDHVPTLYEMYAEKRTWLRITDVVAVAADLKGSTRLDFGRRANSSARLYQAVTGNMVRIVDQFGCDFVDIQGDGLYALYHGDGRYERALCAAITLKTFSELHLIPLVQAQLTDRFPRTGIKVGMHASQLVVKKVGVRGTNEPIWAGKAVNWATKAAQAADANELIVTRKVFQKFEDNDYVRYSCRCGVPTDLWSAVNVEALPDAERTDCRRLQSCWCITCGPEFCQAVLDGKTYREDVM